MHVDSRGSGVIFALLLIVKRAQLASVSQLVKLVDERKADSYHFSFQLSDGQFRDETGKLKDVGSDAVMVVEGTFGFPGTDGKTYKYKYSADEKGYKQTKENSQDPADEDVDSALNSVFSNNSEKGTQEEESSEDLDPGPLIDNRIDPNVIKTLVGR